jgi:tetratricopeptide (TPR) repeat protein
MEEGDAMSKKAEKRLEGLIKEADEIFRDVRRRKESKPLYATALEIAEKMEKKLETGYIKGKIDLIDEKWEDAIKHFDAVIDLKGEFFRAWYYIGFALGKIGNYEGALKCYDKALEIDPEYVDAWNNKGISLDEMGNYEGALKCYDKALEIDPEYLNAWYNKGLSLYDVGKYEEALKCYDKALEIDPEYELARNNRNLTLMRLGKFDEAQKEREKLYLEKKEEIDKSTIPEEERKEKILEIDAQKEVINELKDKYKDILDAKEQYEKTLANSLKPRDNPLHNNFFLVLRRWNSYTPVIPTSTESNVGGGYFLYWKGKGIVIDPGFDFVDNLFDKGLRICDIDAVIITHSHVDHCSDFESILTLLFEYNEKNESKKIDVFMNLGAMKKFLGWIPITGENTLINHVYPLEKGNHYNLEDYNLNLTVTRAIHDEVLTKDYSVGLICELYNEGPYTNDNPFKIGYTSDTKHDKAIETQYKGVDIIIPHLGSIDENDFSTEKTPSHSNHLMLTGVISTIYKSKAKLAIISEFGEELEEHRLTIVTALNRVFQQNKMARCLTGDIGLRVLIPDLKVECHYCKEEEKSVEEKFVDFNEILESIDPENKDKKCVIHYCKKCENIHQREWRKTTQ